MTMGVHVVSEFLAIEPAAVWSLLQRSHPDVLTGQRRCLCGETECSLDEVATVIRKQGKPHFGISFEDGMPSEVSYGHVRNYNHSILSIYGLVADLPDADIWIAPFTGLTSFREGWLLNTDYVHWQNAEDPLEYTAVGRSYEGLPMKSNGLPFPLEQQIIDTSQNPGRCVLRDGYVEAVGSVMWLGEQFWPLTGASKQTVLAANWLQCEAHANGVLRIQAAEAPFTTAEGASGDLQDRLRSLLFPHSQ